MNEAATQQGVETQRRPYSWLGVVFAPWWGIFTPRRAAVRMTGGPRVAWLIAFVLGIGCVAGVFVFLLMWGATVEREWRSPGMPVYEYSFADVWRQWHRDGSIGRAELAVMWVMLLVPVIAGVVAWLFLPTVHREGSAWKSYRRAYQAVASGVGVLAILTLAAGSLMANA
ncbi:MAG TPA: hypothetical protein VMV94_13835, partial [Phycisphaerae bacterium]|nr:hypothetical protein [Phycisphaerae bacterium]